MSENELYEAVCDFLESCHRTGHHDFNDNLNYFLREKRGLDLDADEVGEVFNEVEESNY